MSGLVINDLVSVMFRLFMVILIAVILWFGGFIIFANSLPKILEDTTSQTDVIVVLTGGKGRTAAGIDLLYRHFAPRLFISGVHYGVDVKEILRIFSSDSEWSSTIFLDHQAENTRQNAYETARWIDDNQLSSLRLVTANYHMPRSLLEFQRAIPNSILIIPHPVFSDTLMQDWWTSWGTTIFLLGEYHKTVATWLRHRLFFWESVHGS